MKERTKVILGVLAGAAAGVAVGVALSDSAVSQNIKESLSDASEGLNLKLQNLLEEGKDYLGDLKDKVAQASSDLGEGIQNMEG